MSQQDVYVSKMKLQLDEMNVQMKALEVRAKQATQAAQDKYEEEMDKLREQSKLAGAKLGEMQAAAEGNWHKLVADMEKLRNAFTSSFHYFKSQV